MSSIETEPVIEIDPRRGGNDGIVWSGDFLILEKD